NRKDKNPTIIQAYLHILLAQVQRHIDKQNKTALSKKHLVQFKQFKQILEKHFSENNTAKLYANKLHITQHHLNLICKETTDSSYFAKTFKAFTKQTPQDFKTEMSEKYRTR